MLPIHRLALALALPSLFATPGPAQCCEALAVARSRLAGAAAGGRALFAGGSDPTLVGVGQSDAVDVYDAATGTWSTAQLSLARYGMGAAGVGDLVLFGGGGHSLQTTLQYFLRDRVDVYDASTGAWSTALLSEPRIYLAAAAVGDRVLFAGGFNTPTPPLGQSAVVDVFDASSGSWSTASLSAGRAYLAATSVGDTALFAGGSGPGLWGGGASDVVDLYDALSGTWSTATLSVARANLAATSAGSYALFAGGSDALGNASTVVDVYDASTGLWSTAALSAPRTWLSAASDGERAFFAGGTDNSIPGVNAPSARVDVFDAASGAWSSFELCQARSLLAAAAVDGQVLFAGGVGSSISFDTVDRLPVGFPRGSCFGDGGGAPCPCANPGAPGRGCANSAAAGALLVGSGCTSVTADGLVLTGSELVVGQPALAFVGLNATGGGSGLAFGDGLRCVGGSVVRLGTAAPDALGGASWGPGLGAAGAWVAGDLRRFQLWYRDPSGPCGSGFNLSNGVEVTFAP